MPPVNTTNLNNSSLTFDVAYALYSSTGFSDTLEVYVQAGCDAPWQRGYKKFNPNLQTAPNTTFNLNHPKHNGEEILFFWMLIR
ncbi:MAG: hypothetical protein IPN09_15720 [Bacteroidetes bacterium]|nr:hypothetical protein [Bacteroidota bacterium]